MAKKLKGLSFLSSGNEAETIEAAASEVQTATPEPTEEVERCASREDRRTEAERQKILEMTENLSLDEVAVLCAKASQERKSERMNIALFPSLKRRLKTVAEKERSSVNDMVIRLLDRGLKQYEH